MSHAVGQKSSGSLRWWLVFVAVMSLTYTGCATLRPPWPRPKVACVLPPNPTLEQVVAHVNGNVEKVSGYHASSLRIRANNMPLSGDLVVERGKHLRLQVTSLVGPEVDLGSNDEVFWIWAKRNEPAGVYYAAHDDMDVARRNLPIPFEPEWLMEALGVAPLSTVNVTMENPPGGSIRLVSQHQLPGGESIRKVVVVNPCSGQVIEHSSYDASGRVLVRALLQDYRLDPKSGAMVARHIKLDWPKAEMSLAMDLNQLDVNPASTSPTIWEMPHVPGCPMVNLAPQRRPGQSEQMLAQPARVRITDEPYTLTSGPQRMAYVPPDDDFRAPEIGGKGPVTLDEPIPFEPPIHDTGRGPSAAAMPALSPF